MENPSQQILDYFQGITVSGIDITPALSISLRIWAYHERFNDQPGRWSDLAYHLGAWPSVFVRRFRRQLPTQLLHLSPSDYLFLMTGHARAARLSVPVAEALKPETVSAIWTKRTLNSSSLPFEYAWDLQQLPVSVDKWQKAFKMVWPELNSRLMSAQARFNLSHTMLYEMQSILTGAIVNIFRAQQVLHQVQPKVLVVEHDRQSAEAIFCQVARQQGIPSITLVHGTQANQSLDSTQWTPVLADRIIVWGEWMRDYFHAIGTESERITIGGYPRLRLLTQADSEQARALLQQHDVKPSRPFVLLLSSYIREHKPAVELFWRVQAQHPNINFMIRPHPQETLEWYHKRGIASIQDPAIWSMEASLSAADIVVGSGSTACLDAIIVGKPVAFIPDTAGDDYTTLPIVEDAIASGAALVAPNAEELSERLSQLLDSGEIAYFQKRTQRFATKAAAYLGRAAAQRTADIIIRSSEGKPLSVSEPGTD